MTSSNGSISRVTGPLCGEFTGDFPSQGPVMWSFDIFFDLCLNKRLSKQSWGWWFETPSRSLWHHCNERDTNANLILLGTLGRSLITLRPKKCHHFADDDFGGIFCNENVWIPINITLMFVSESQIDNIPPMVQIMDHYGYTTNAATLTSRMFMV